MHPCCPRILHARRPSQTVTCYSDVRTLTAERLRADGIGPDVICGGFPCQDISVAGQGAGIEGPQSGLWSEYARLIGELRPRYVIVENVAALLGRGLDKVLGDLAEIGYDAEWHCIPASYVGARHIRDRLWIVAYPISAGTRVAQYRGRGQERADAGTLEPAMVSPGDWPGGAEGTAPSDREIPDADRKPLVGAAIARQEFRPWDIEPEMGRVVDGVPHRLVEDELTALGNSVVPQIPEIIGRAIMNRENSL